MISNLREEVPIFNRITTYYIVDKIAPISITCKKWETEWKIHSRKKKYQTLSEKGNANNKKSEGKVKK